MKEFKSAFKPAIEEYLEFRSAMGYCNEHEHLNAERYKVSDEELLKRLCGLK